MKTQLVRDAVARLRGVFDGGLDDRDVDAGRSMGPAIREAVALLQNYLLARSAADGAEADRAARQEAAALPAEDTYEGLLAMVREAARERDGQERRYERAVAFGVRILRDSGVPVHCATLSRAIYHGMKPAQLSTMHAVSMLAERAGKGKGYEVEGGRVCKDFTGSYFWFTETKPRAGRD